ncbi:DUF6685 family protein [Stutzerimonas chloritidismutans]
MQIQRWRCDIQQVDGFSASKSELKEFATMDDMVVRNSPEMIDEISPAKLAKNLAWDEIRIRPSVSPIGPAMVAVAAVSD